MTEQTAITPRIKGEKTAVNISSGVAKEVRSLVMAANVTMFCKNKNKRLIMMFYKVVTKIYE
jgi:hypothetical protein